MTHTTQPSSTPITAEGAVKILRDAIKKQLDTAWECNSDHPALRAAIAATDPAAIQQAVSQSAPIEAGSAQDDEPDAADEWRRLALQFDGHRMQALAILRLMVNGTGHAEMAREFLAAPPLSGEKVLTQRIAALSRQSAPIEAGEMPPLPRHPEHHMLWTTLEKQALLAYGQLCRDTARPASSVTSDAKIPCWSCNYHYTQPELTANGDVCPRCAATIPAPSGVPSSPGIYEIQRNAAESAIGDELASLGLIDSPTVLPNMVLLAGIQALCISANQECSRRGGNLSASDIGWFTGQLHIFDMYTPVDKSAIAEARAYIEKLALLDPSFNETNRESEMDVVESKEIDKRDLYHDWADKLAEAIAKHFNAEIGEHSSVNCPWAEALEVIEAATKPASTAPATGSIADDAEFRKLAINWFHRNDKPSFDSFIAYLDARQSVAAPEAVKGKASDAEDYLRTRYGAYRGHHAWRELEEAFNAGLAARAQQQGAAIKIVPDWPYCNPGCDYEDPNGGHHDGRDEHCSCEAAKASICRQRATPKAETVKGAGQ